MADSSVDQQQSAAEAGKRGGTTTTATLLALAGGLLVALFVSGTTAITVAMALPLLLLFSPVLVPATVALLAATGTVAWGALAMVGLALLARNAVAAVTPRDYMAEGKRRVAELAGRQKMAHVEAGQAMHGNTTTN